ncbi:MAG: hypothetical protein GF329_17075 [Candidatus Lokiarchaeota archaeon]|nr:hypothetical protein [Candidatus Lokiarchaeota archaeon]
MTDKIIQCPVCKKSLTFEVDVSEFEPYERFPIPCIIKHNDHWISLYLDSDTSICDVEIPIVKQSKE